MRRSFAFVALSLALTVASTVHAEDSAPSAEDVKQAAASFDKGRDAYRLESFTEAAEQFEAADSFAPSAAALRLAMLSRKAAGQMDRAATHAALGVSLYPEDATLQKEGQELLDAQAALLGRISVTCDENCDLLLDSKLVHGKAAASRTLYVTPGSHSLRATWSDKRARSKNVKVDAGAVESVGFTAPPIPVTPAAEPVVAGGAAGDPKAEEKKGGWSPVVFWTGAGLTAAGGVATVILGINAQNNPGVDKVREECGGSEDPTCPAYQQGLQNQMYANVAIGATVGLGLFTIVTGVFLTDWSGSSDTADASAARRKPRPEFTVRPTFSIGSGATVGATGTF